jgi:NADH dehydrogenase FAD-containing subunit
VEASYFGHDEWARFAPGMKTLDEGIALRSRVLEAFELAELQEDPGAMPELTTFVIVGGGPTGCELAGSFAEMFRETLARQFRRFDPTRARVILVEAGARLLPAFAPELAEKAFRELERIGVEVRLNSPVEAIDADGVTIAGKRIDSRTVIWAAGIRAGMWFAGSERDRQADRGAARPGGARSPRICGRMRPPSGKDRTLPVAQWRSDGGVAVDTAAAAGQPALHRLSTMTREHGDHRPRSPS